PLDSPSVRAVWTLNGWRGPQVSEDRQISPGTPIQVLPMMDGRPWQPSAAGRAWLAAELRALAVVVGATVHGPTAAYHPDTADLDTTVELAGGQSPTEAGTSTGNA